MALYSLYILTLIGNLEAHKDDISDAAKKDIIVNILLPYNIRGYLTKERIVEELSLLVDNLF